MRPETAPETGPDVVDLLVAQHEEIERLFDEVERAGDAARADAFDRLRRYLAVYETAEELIVRPDARRAAGDAVVDARLAEEHAAKELLDELTEAGVAAPGFGTRLGELRELVWTHAEWEEREEFPALREAHGDSVRATMGAAVLAVEALAPSRAPGARVGAGASSVPGDAGPGAGRGGQGNEVNTR
jgi:hemerythrin superfamily protein